jgi:tripeptide aminopeptidase
VGSQPVVRGDEIVPASSETALGADDRSGAAVVLNTALEILRRGLPHPPLTMLWTVQEEAGLCGARFGEIGLLGKPRLAFNFDGGSHEKITIGATGGYRFRIRVYGIASHAGSAPEKGVSAIAIAALAIARLHEEGWHGLIERRGRQGTSNVGVVQGGEATNVVTPYVELRAEARSHNPVFRQQIIRAIEKAFRQAARSVRNADGAAGRVEIDGQLDYEAFRLADEEPCVLTAEAAVRSVGGEPLRAISNGGLDANWMTARGIPTVSLGCGQQNPHTTSERLNLVEFRQACRVALRLATRTE